MDNRHHFKPELSAAANFKVFKSFVENNHDDAFRFISDILWSHISNVDTTELSETDEELFFALKSRVEKVLARTVTEELAETYKTGWGAMDVVIDFLAQGYFPIIAPKSIEKDLLAALAGPGFEDWRAKLKFI